MTNKLFYNYTVNNTYSDNLGELIMILNPQEIESILKQLEAYKIFHYWNKKYLEKGTDLQISILLDEVELNDANQLQIIANNSNNQLVFTIIKQYRTGSLIYCLHTPEITINNLSNKFNND